MSKYELGIYEYYHPLLHGDHVEHYDKLLVYCLFPLNEFYYDFEEIENEVLFIQEVYSEFNSNLFNNIDYHPILKNYKNIKNKINLEIIETISLNDGTLFCIIKTYLLKIIQRKWKKYFKNLKNKLTFIKKNPSCIIQRQIYGKINFK